MPRAARSFILQARILACLFGLVLLLSLTACSAPATVSPQESSQPAQPTAVPAVAEAPVPQASLPVTENKPEEDAPLPEFLDQVEAEIEEEAEATLLTGSAAVPVLLTTEAPGLLQKACNRAVIDYSNTNDGYVMAVYSAETCNALRLRVIGPSTTYTYVIIPGEWAAFPLSDGNGKYQVVIYEQVSGKKYATVLSASFTVAMEDEFAPFLRPNQYVNYADATETIKKATELAAGQQDPLEIVSIIYTYVVRTLCYDTIKAQSVTTGYLPVLDEVLAARRGICFDYAALMTGMLRSLGIPCKLVVGYVGTAYHAWINVYVEGTGWMDGVIYFDGQSWQRMDPTFASSTGGTKFIESYIGKGTEYSPRYFY